MRGERLPSAVDVAVIGGGINGASVYHELARAGYRVLLVERGDFASGTSQASAMMIWGGLLYLKDWELATVARLSASRDRLIAAARSQVRVRTIRYVPEPGGRSRAFVQAVLYAYWLLGAARRRRPRFDADFEERQLLRRQGIGGALTYEEAALESSDARFVLEWILGANRGRGTARNYCALASAAFDPVLKSWRLDLLDAEEGAAHVRARLVVNAAGGWTDEINRLAGIDSPFRHLLSRGVSISVPRHPAHQHHLAFDNGVCGNAMAFVPWGPVGLWGSTDTLHADMASAQRVGRADVAYLLAQLNRHLAHPVGADDVVSVRCGVRPVAVRRSTRPDEYSPNLSRRHRIHADRQRPWVSVYGGKLSGCTTLARSVRQQVAWRIGAAHGPGETAGSAAHEPALESFPGIERPVVAAWWSAAHERCRTVEDYLRRRTNIAQWIRRGGFGANLEYSNRIRSIALALHHGDERRAAADVDRYRAVADREWRLLQGVTR